MTEKDRLLSIKIAEKIKAAGGTAYYVGGCVRDKLCNIPCSDIDIEVHGINADELKNILSSAGEVISYGESFGIFSIKGSSVDIALPRKEKATGKGHRDFSVFTDPFIGTYKAAIRRDFTVNAMMENILTGEIIDHFGGRQDLNNKILRHVNDESFGEDPLRVMRLAQFAARFGFTPAESTKEICRKTDVSALSRERVYEEMKKALLKAPAPSVFFEVLRDTDALSFWFPEVKALIGVPQNPLYHPEGDVWVHTMRVLDTAALYRDRVSFPVGFMLSSLCHDFGKAVCTELKEGRIISYKHETLGLPYVKTFLTRLTDEKKLISYVLNMVELHMRPNALIAQNSGIKATNRLFDEAISPEDLIYFSSCDRMKENKENEAYLFSRLEIYKNIMSEPFVTGSDLIKAGLKPDGNFSEALEYAHKLRLSGVKKSEALACTVSFARKKFKY